MKSNTSISSMYNMNGNTLQSNQNYKIGTYRVSNYQKDQLSAKMAQLSQIKKMAPCIPSSISMREQTLHLSSTELRLQDYYLIRTKKLPQNYQILIQNATQQRSFSEQLLNSFTNQTLQLLPYSSQKPLQFPKVVCNSINKNNQPFLKINNQNNNMFQQKQPTNSNAVSNNTSNQQSAYFNGTLNNCRQNTQQRLEKNNITPQWNINNQNNNSSNQNNNAFMNSKNANFLPNMKNNQNTFIKPPVNAIQINNLSNQRNSSILSEQNNVNPQKKIDWNNGGIIQTGIQQNNTNSTNLTNNMNFMKNDNSAYCNNYINNLNQNSSNTNTNQIKKANAGYSSNLYPSNNKNNLINNYNNNNNNYNNNNYNTTSNYSTTQQPYLNSLSNNTVNQISAQFKFDQFLAVQQRMMNYFSNSLIQQAPSQPYKQKSTSISQNYHFINDDIQEYLHVPQQEHTTIYIRVIPKSIKQNYQSKQLDRNLTQNNRSSYPNISEFEIDNNEFNIILLYKVIIRWVESPRQTIINQGELKVLNSTKQTQIKNILFEILRQKYQWIRQDAQFNIFPLQNSKYKNQFILQGKILQKKINLPAKYHAFPQYFEKFKVQNLRIISEFGSVEWAGTTDIYKVDFSTGIQLQSSSIQCKIKVLNKICTVNFTSLPKPVQNILSKGLLQMAQQTLLQLVSKVNPNFKLLSCNIAAKQWSILINKFTVSQ